MEVRISRSLISHEDGFSLIELMIVVAIIGILATIATGSFLSYQSRAKQAEAKTNLSSIGELALSFKAEHDTFVADWNDLGWTAQGTTRYRYWYNGEQAVDTPTAPESGIDYSDPGSTAAEGTFTVAAVGNIDEDFATDQWFYDQDRLFTLQQSDVSTN